MLVDNLCIKSVNQSKGKFRAAAGADGDIGEEGILLLYCLFEEQLGEATSMDMQHC